jgi:hypothetical protein
MSNTILSFQKWIQGEKPKVITQDTLQKKYTDYLKNTQTQTLCADAVNNEYVKQQYIDLIKSVAINYTSEEEKRYLINIDYNNADDLRTVIPFFVKKLKSILIQTSKEREKAKFSTVKYNLRGSKFGLETFIVNDIQQALADEDFRKKYPNAPTAQFFVENYNLIYEELYDFYQHYNDLDPSQPVNEYVTALDSERFQYYLTNVVDNNPQLFLNIKSVIYNQANAITYRLVSKNNRTFLTRRTRVITVTYNTNNINNIESRYFLYGIKTEATHIANLTKQLIQKYIAQNTSYVTSLTSIPLVTNADLQSNNTNKYFPSIAAIPSAINLQTKNETGGFFLPQLLAKVYFVSKYYQPILNVPLSGSYVVPDSKYLLPGRGQTLRNQPTPYTQAESYAWAVESNIYQSKWNYPTDSRKYAKFYGYESKEEIYNQAQQGVNTSSDNFEFFGGIKSDLWANQDVFLVTDLDNYPIEERIKSLNLVPEDIYTWQTDIYGNNFALYKDTNLQRTVLFPGNPYTDTTEILASQLVPQVPGVDDPNTYIINLGLGKDNSHAMFNYRTSAANSDFSTVIQTLTGDKTIFEKFTAVTGNIRLRTVNSAVVTTLSSAMSGVFNKYTGDTLAEIYDTVLKFFVIENFIVVETPNYIVFEQYEFNQLTNSFVSILPASILLNK